MRVKEIMDILGRLDPDAEVWVHARTYKGQPELHVHMGEAEFRREFAGREVARPQTFYVLVEDEVIYYGRVDSQDSRDELPEKVTL